MIRKGTLPSFFPGTEGYIGGMISIPFNIIYIGGGGHWHEQYDKIKVQESENTRQFKMLVMCCLSPIFSIRAHELLNSLEALRAINHLNLRLHLLGLLFI